MGDIVNNRTWPSQEKLLYVQYNESHITFVYIVYSPYMTEKMHYCILILYVPIEINDEKYSACAEQNTTY